MVSAEERVAAPSLGAGEDAFARDERVRAQEALLSRIRRAKGQSPSARGEAPLAQGDAIGMASQVHRNKPMGHGVAVDSEALLARKDADLGDVERAFGVLKSVFENFQRGTGYLPVGLRESVNDLEACVVMKLRPVREALQKARKVAG